MAAIRLFLLLVVCTCVHSSFMSHMREKLKEAEAKASHEVKEVEGGAKHDLGSLISKMGNAAKKEKANTASILEEIKRAAAKKAHEAETDVDETRANIVKKMTTASDHVKAAVQEELPNKEQTFFQRLRKVANKPDTQGAKARENSRKKPFQRLRDIIAKAKKDN
eukprot:TRINITY_DN94872_c0_g1_i1.p1 TRINITY_DN94872_c0_g1~~TRINITY_DN94872_c0_g1_i1.p1  ORF type:complete len:177 (-),score=39.95 TRINITY_DN94872_c0_g1_i1:116-610(-)